MAAFFIANVTVKDPEKFQAYAAKAGETMKKYHGEVALRGKFEQGLKGDADHHAVAVVRFPSHDDLRSWYFSEAYQAVIPLRDEAAEMSITTYVEP
ncbi:MAG TPA: DUF1330 domain-containing protein [Gammaproteobacteria bacterium]|nr:DUF1330 domain-containing protein [Gammaproteobacteria bacterium]